MSFTNPSDNEIRTILSTPATVAVVGCSDNPDRDSLRIAMLLRHKGFRVIPVNPQLGPDALRKELGERCYPDLESIPDPVRDSRCLPPAGVPTGNHRAGDSQGGPHPLGTVGRGQPGGGRNRGERRSYAGDGPVSGDRIPAAILNGYRATCRSQPTRGSRGRDAPLRETPS